MSTKQRVRYIDLGYCVIGQSAVVLPLDHPSDLVSNRTWAQTSPVVSIIDQANGKVFETRNTVYWPAETDESLPEALQKGAPIES